VEVGALRGILIDGGGILANGANGGGVIGGCGAVAGGGILLHADSVTLLSVLSARGGDGGRSSVLSSGGGGGGRVLILTEPGGFAGTGAIDVSGGLGGDLPGTGFDGVAGSAGQVAIGEGSLLIPAPASLTLLWHRLSCLDQLPASTASNVRHGRLPELNAYVVSAASAFRRTRHGSANARRVRPGHYVLSG
jgi:hypothetical protein